MSANIQQQNSSSGTGPLAGFRARFASGDLGLIPVIIALIVIWIVFQSVNGNFLSGRNLSNLILQIAEIGMLGIGETFVLLLGEIDLSIGAVSGVAAAVLVLLSVAGVNPWVCIVASVVSGGLIGLFQGFWVTIIGVPAFIVTLAGSLGYQGILLGMLGNTGTVPISNKTLLNLTSTYVPPWLGWVMVIVVVVLYAGGTFMMQKNRERRQLPAQSTGATLFRSLILVVVSAIVIGVLNTYRGLPVAGFILLVFVVLFAFVTQSTVYGRHIYALGGNKEAARRAGINTRTIKISIFTLAGLMGAIGGIIGASRLGSASPASGGGNLLMDSIAAAVIGGTSLFGGRGSMWNALAGALVIGSVENGMDLLSAPSSTKYIVEGGILLLAVTIDTFTRRRRTQAGR
ncbi:sugar ABC transporter permease [Alicyclobacillus fastidiosus]|uniref:Xylose transport system permease protein XylH n=1 Tax=Alicyclobacillus fastidiosus TaxID=392011 RepID=A0ABV5AE43_9BACL|nr:ABC transporter permease [Alicyclobacillus fastidiosus]WEH09870.1 ABC transporter permease [Alicyclobacillus fastidiosus]